MNIDDGGRAFPSAPNASIHRDGMSLRDYLAAHVDIGDVDDLPVLLGEQLLGREIPSYHDDVLGCLAWRAEYRARLRYIEADAMIKARKGGAA